MKKIIFFIENAWAFGTIHQSLSKVLFQHDILADVLDWNNSYQQQDMDYISRNYDYFVTLPLAINALTSYGIPLEKIIVIAHGQWDFLKASEQLNAAIYDQVAGYAVVSENLKEKSKEFGINRVPVVTPIGIIVDNFIRPVPKKLETIGYASSFVHHNYQGDDIKRGRLVQTVAAKTHLKLVLNQKFHYLGMPAFYESVDAVIMSSTEESVGLPMMEAAAAGRLTVGTPVGYYALNGKPSGGIVAPLDERQFVNKVSKQLIYYKANPIDYQKVCRNIQSYAKKHYDWSHHIDKWVSLFSH